VENRLGLSRRSFLKLVSAAIGVSIIPDIGVSISAPEPRWSVEKFDWGGSFGVGAQWGNGKNIVRHAIHMAMPLEPDRERKVDTCKQALRQWYVERQLKAA